VNVTGEEGIDTRYRIGDGEQLDLIRPHFTTEEISEVRETTWIEAVVLRIFSFSDPVTVRMIFCPFYCQRLARSDNV
jgi:hypothetical protein